MSQKRISNLQDLRHSDLVEKAKNSQRNGDISIVNFQEHQQEVDLLRNSCNLDDRGKFSHKYEPQHISKIINKYLVSPKVPQTPDTHDLERQDNSNLNSNQPVENRRFHKSRNVVILDSRQESKEGKSAGRPNIFINQTNFAPAKLQFNQKADNKRGNKDQPKPQSASTNQFDSHFSQIQTTPKLPFRNTRLRQIHTDTHFPGRLSTSPSYKDQKSLIFDPKLKPSLSVRKKMVEVSAGSQKLSVSQQIKDMRKFWSQKEVDTTPEN